MGKDSAVKLLSNHASALLLVASDRRIRIRDIASSLMVSERSAQGIVADLVAGGYLVRQHEGRRNVYELNVAMPVALPLRHDETVGHFLSALSTPAKASSATDFVEAFSQSAIPTVALTLEGTVLHTNRAADELFEMSCESLTGRSWREFVFADDEEIWRDIWHQIRAGEDVGLSQQRVRRVDGTVVWTSMFVSTSRLPDGSALNYFVHMMDISDLKQLEEQLETQLDYFNHYDALTGLANSSLLRESLVVSRGQSRCSGAKIGVIAIRVEHFKHHYTTLGQERGDELVRKIAIRLATTIGPDELAARIGDDDFVVMCVSQAAERTAQLADSILNSFRVPFVVDGRHVTVSVSVGVVVSGYESDVEQLLRDSEVAVARAMETGGNRVVHADVVLGRLAERRRLLMTALVGAMEAEEFSLHYQPIVNLANGRLSGAEALLRWSNPGLGAIGPSEFIPFIEELGLIGEIGAWVINQACHQLAQWNTREEQLTMSVNVSVLQVMTTDLVSVIQSALSESQLAGESLILELTESVLMEDADHFAVILRQLKDLNVRLAIDDFGTGYSSLGRLKGFPVDDLKVDQVFIRGLGVDEQDTSLVGAIIAMARSLHLTVTAEGIENETQLDHLRRLGCDMGQGFHLGRPVSASAMTELIEASPRWTFDE